ncbi:hypothetical protein M9Y10_026184 [Tritrichomonas musculus]|uniref:Leucine Rich Repeat family protein n=1 Tax=Tritrichomonas musculus TaxID=1915356 RepID=A0ABR2H6Y0_9EUKA
MACLQFICFIPLSEKVISSVNLQQILPGGYHREISLVITEFNLRLFLENNSSSGFKEVACRPYSSLFLVDFIDDLTFRLVFSTNNNNMNPYDGRNIVTYTFISETSNSIIELLYKTAIITLPNGNYLRVNRKIKDFKSPNNKIQTFIHRYRALLAWKRIFPPQISLQKLENYLLSDPAVINLQTIMELDFDIETFIHATDVIPKLNTIVIQGGANYSLLYDILKKVLLLCPHIQNIAIMYQIDHSFSNFLNFLSKQSKISIQSIQFRNSQISPSLVKSIQTLLMKHKLSLTFENCDLSQSLNRLLSIKNLTNLNLHSNLMNFQDFPQMKNLTHLSLKGCRIDICPLLSSLKEKVPNIEYLDLSKNECISELPQTISLPKTLKELFLSNVHFSSKNFAIIFKSSCFSYQPISLSLADPIFDSRKDSFSHFFDSFKKEIQNIQNPNLAALYWNHNHIRSVLLKFLLKCNNLKFVSFSGCKIKKHVIPALKKFIENHSGIQTIDLHGSIRVTFTGKLHKLFYWLKKSKSVRQVDVSKNKLNEKCITSLADLIASNSRLSQILIDDIEVDNFSSVQPLVNAIKERKESINVQFPDKAFLKLKQKGQIDDQNFNSIRALFEHPVAYKELDYAAYWQNLIDQRYPEWPFINSVNLAQIVDLNGKKMQV